MFKPDLEKAEEPRDQIANICWIIKKAREFQKNFCFFDYAKAFDCVEHNKLWKILKEMGIPDHLTCLLSNLYADQEATVRTGHGTTDWFQIDNLKMLVPWKKIYDQLRQHIKKQRYYFANKGPSNQSYGFSSSHIWM